LHNAAHVTFLSQIETALNYWAGGNPNLSKLLNPAFLADLVSNGYVPSEREQRRRRDIVGKRRRERGDTPVAALFGREPALFVPPPPEIVANMAVDEEDGDDEDWIDAFDEDVTEEDFEVRPPEPAPAQDGQNRVFVMTLRQTDVGYGMTNPRRKTQARSPEVFIPLAARDFDPDFWGWQQYFAEDPQRPGKWDRRNVKIMLGGKITEVSMMTWPVKHDFRLRGQPIRLAANVDDILRIERTDGSGGYSYFVEIIPRGTIEYEEHLQKCVQKPRSSNSNKRWGYF